ncbi:MAG: replicative DNA helicase, partial [Eubacteriales bacterium]|nr:replicative DNA helicase [Eubacteriales bacterium]
KSVLGALMQDANAVTEALLVLSSEDFYNPQHAAIFDAIVYLNRKSQAVDLVTMDAELSRTGKLEGVGGVEYLVELIQFVPTTVHLRHYINIVLEKSTLRKLINASNEISRNCFRQDMEMQDILLHAEKSIFDIVMRRNGSKRLVHISEVMQLTYRSMEEMARNKGKVAGVPTGFTLLDNLLTGLHQGELVLVGARPSMGKTSFAINIATHAALKGFTTAIFSLEMPNEQIAMRVLCCEARVNMQNTRNGTLSDSDWGKLAMAIAPLANAPFYMDDTSSLTPTQLRSRCRRLMMETGGLDLIVIDYLQLMTTDTKSENRQLEVSEISRRLKSIALELKVPILACAQLSRANMQRATKKPLLSDLRDSGSIEQDADVVMFLHRESYYEEDSEETNIAEVIVAKQRNGPLGTIKLYWHDDYTLFEDLRSE